MDQGVEVLLASLNSTQHARWRAALVEWYDVYNPHIADVAAMHREQILFDMARPQHGFHAELENVVDGLAAIMHKDALRVLYEHLGVKPRQSPKPITMEYIYVWQNPHARPVESVIDEIGTTGAINHSYNLGSLMCDRRLRPAHMRALLGTRFRHTVWMAFESFKYNPLCDSSQSARESTTAIAAWRRNACDVLAAVTTVVGSTLARVIAEYLWERHEPPSLVA
jgi:hypothetical protein